MPPSRNIGAEIMKELTAKIIALDNQLNTYVAEWSNESKIAADELASEIGKIILRNDTADDTFHLSLDDIEKQNFEIQEK